MAERRFRVPASVAATIRGLHPGLKRKVRAALTRILADPGEGKALQRELAGLRSYRVGRFRVIYQEAGGNVELVAVGPRASVYAETYRLLKRG